MRGCYTLGVADLERKCQVDLLLRTHIAQLQLEGALLLRQFVFKDGRLL
jgi:hypothetical protein